MNTETGTTALTVNTEDGTNHQDNNEASLKREAPAHESGFIKFYGLYWRKDQIDWSKRQLLGQPRGWMNQGKLAANFDRRNLQMNFWNQKGVYVLYDQGLHPVYAGQAGLTRKDSKFGQAIGDRLNMHRQGVYRNGWSLFSWFGFMEVDKFDLRKENNEKLRLSPEWNFSQQQSDLNLLLASFEAILIEGFAPRFNARGGDLKRAVLVNQFESLENSFPHSISNRA